MKSKFIILRTWLFAMLMAGGTTHAQTPLGTLEKLNISELEVGASVDCYIVYKTPVESENWLALNHDETAVERGTQGTQNERLFVGFTELLEADRYDTKYCWKITRDDDQRYIVEWSVPVPYATTKSQYIDENGLIRADGHSDWMKYYAYEDTQTGAYTLGHALGSNGNSSSRKCCWKYDEVNNRLGITNGAFANDCIHSHDFYFLRFEHSGTSEADIASYQIAFDNALEILEEMQQYASNLEDLKATDAGDYGKFDPAKIEILQKLGSTYTRDLFTTTSERTEVIAATQMLSSLIGLKHTYYMGGDFGNLSTGFYRVKVAGSGNYLTYSGEFKFSVSNEAENQLFYLNKTLNNNDTRFALYSYPELNKNNLVSLKGAQNSFFNLCESGIVEGQATYTFKSGGTGNPTISYIDEEGKFAYGTLDQYRDLHYRLVLEPVENLFVREENIVDGIYELSFNGSLSNQQVSITDGKVTVSGIPYEVNRYGSHYAIGKNDEYGYFTSESLLKETQDGKIDAMPRAGFRLSPRVDGEKVLVSSLTHFGHGDLVGKTVKVTGTVDFSNLEEAGAGSIEVVDNQPFFAHENVALSTTVTYTRAFNTEAEGEYSTAADPRWEAICLPFEVQNVIGSCPIVSGEGNSSWDGSSRELDPSKDFWLYELTSTGFTRTTTLEANKPYIIAFPYSWVEDDKSRSYAPQLNVSGDVQFCGSVIAATVDEEDLSADFKLVTNFRQWEAAEDIYVLDASGLYFEKGITNALPFRPFAVLSESNQLSPSRIYIENNEPTDISTKPSVSESIRIISVAGGIEVTSEESQYVTIYTIGGTVLGRLQVEQGVQTISLPIGTFIVNGVKVIVTE